MTIRYKVSVHSLGQMRAAGEPVPADCPADVMRHYERRGMAGEVADDDPDAVAFDRRAAAKKKAEAEAADHQGNIDRQQAHSKKLGKVGKAKGKKSGKAAPDAAEPADPVAAEPAEA